MLVVYDTISFRLFVESGLGNSHRGCAAYYCPDLCQPKRQNHSSWLKFLASFTLLGDRKPMINIGGNPLMILLAIIAALGGVGLYFVRNLRPELARDHDIFFSAIALVYGIIVLAFNFRMEITTQLAQVLVVGFGGWFAVESLVLRQALANQARRSPMPPIMDDEPPAPEPSSFRVEVDPARDRRERNTRRMRGTANFDGDRSSELEGDIADRAEPKSRRRTRRPTNLPDDNISSEAVIDIEDGDVQSITPSHRRPRRSENRSQRNSTRRKGVIESSEFEDF